MSNRKSITAPPAADASAEDIKAQRQEIRQAIYQLQSKKRLSNADEVRLENLKSFLKTLEEDYGQDTYTPGSGPSETVKAYAEARSKNTETSEVDRLRADISALQSKRRSDAEEKKLTALLAELKSIQSGEVLIESSAVPLKRTPSQDLLKYARESSGEESSDVVQIRAQLYGLDPKSMKAKRLSHELRVAQDRESYDSPRRPSSSEDTQSRVQLLKSIMFMGSSREGSRRGSTDSTASLSGYDSETQLEIRECRSKLAALNAKSNKSDSVKAQVGALQHKLKELLSTKEEKSAGDLWRSVLPKYRRWKGNLTTLGENS